MIRPPQLLYHVTFEAGRWCVWLAGSADAAEHFARKEDAIRVAIRLASSAPPSQLLVHASDGSLEFARQFGSAAASAPRESSEYFIIGPGRVARDEY